MGVERISELSVLINCGDYVDENEYILLCVELLIVNNLGNTDKSEYPFWNAMVHVVDMDGAGAHVRRHTKRGNLDITTNISYDPPIKSIAQLIKLTV